MVKTREKLGYISYMNPKKTISYYVLSALMQITNRELTSLGIYNVYSKISSSDEFFNLYFVFDRDETVYKNTRHTQMFQILVNKCERWYEATKVYNMNGKIITKTFDIYCSNMDYDEALKAQIYHIYNSKFNKLSKDYKSFFLNKMSSVYKDNEHLEDWHSKVYSKNISYYMFAQDDQLRKEIAENLGVSVSILPEELVEVFDFDKETIFLK